MNGGRKIAYRIGRLIVNAESGEIMEENVSPYFRTLSWHLPGNTAENNESHYWG
jgi:hypothetical protein